jgi:licheninase
MRRSLTIAAVVGTVVLASASTAGAAPRQAPPPPAAPGTSAGHETSAAALHGWGEPNRVEEFNGPLDGSWNVYDGPGHAGKGRRTPSAISFADGIMTITGSPEGDTAGMGWEPGQRYGRWEGRVKAPASDESYNALLLLWPDAEDFPVGGEIDFMEMLDHTRQTTNIFLHYGKDNDQIAGEVQIDGTQWHNWAVEWAPTHIAAFVDGKEWWRTERTEIFPPRAMHLCVQLDWFPDDGQGEVQESHMLVDWVKQYSYPGADGGEGGPAPLTEGSPDALRSSQRAQSGQPR